MIDPTRRQRIRVFFWVGLVAVSLGVIFLWGDFKNQAADRARTASETSPADLRHTPESQSTAGISGISASPYRDRSTGVLGLDTVVVTACDSIGNPFPRARVITFDDTQVVGDSVTDLNGELICPKEWSITSFLVIPIDGAPYVTSTTLREANKSRLVAPHGSSIVGVVTVDDLPAASPVDLYVTAQKPWIPVGAVPSFVLDRLPPESKSLSGMKLVTSDAGGFSVRGLQSDKALTLAPGDEYQIRTHATLISSSIEVMPNDPAHPIVVSLVAVPSVIGRVVSDRDSMPVGSASLQITVRTKDGSSRRSCMTDSKGHFRLPIRNVSEMQSGSRCTVSVEVVETGFGSTSAADFEADFATGLDVGTIRLIASSMAVVTVVDTAGVMIKDAKIELPWANSKPVLPSEDGLLRFVAPRVPSFIFVSAKGYLTKTVSSGADAVDPVRIVLERSRCLEIRVTSLDGRPASGVRLNIEGTIRSPLLTIANVRQRVFHGRPYGSSTPPNDGRQVWVDLDATGKINLEELDQQDRLRITINDALGTEVDSREFTGSPEEHRVVDWKLPVSVGSMKFKVRDDQGQPTRLARLGLRRAELGNASKSIRVDQHGQAFVHGILARAALLDVSCAGLQSIRLELSPEVILSGSIEIVLRVGREAEIRVVDQLGVSVEPDSVALFDANREISSTREVVIAPGHRKYFDLPERPIKFVVSVAGREHTATDAGIHAILTIRVPVTGMLEVGWESMSETAALVGDPMECVVEAIGLDPLLPRRQGLVGLKGDLQRRTYVFENIIPGRYRVVMKYGGAKFNIGDLTRTQEVLVEPGQRARVVIRP